jgi:hypothetical protein
MQKVQDDQEDLAWGRRYFLERKATDHEFLMLAVYLNVVKGFVPQACLRMHDAEAAGALSPQRCRYKMAISTVHTGVVPESVMCSVKRLMEFLKGHIRSGGQKTTLRGNLARVWNSETACQSHQNFGETKVLYEMRALKTLLPTCMLPRLGPVSYANVQLNMSKKQKKSCINDQGLTMVRMTRCP